MLTQLKFVQGAVAKKDFIPAMTHFQIQRGTVRAYNGVLALSSPIPFDVDCRPKAASLVQAIGKCEETITLSMNSDGKLQIRSGKFSAFIECLRDEDDTMPIIMPEGVRVDFNGAEFLKGMKALHAFIGEDASRPWTNGVLVRGASAFATNNVCLVEYWFGSHTPFNANIPITAVNEIIRIGEAPTHAQVEGSSITFHYSDDRWIRSQLYSMDWPDVAKILDSSVGHPIPLPESLFEALDAIRPFVDKMGRVFVTPGSVRTHEHEQGAAFELLELQHYGIYQIEMLRLLQGVAQALDFSMYPNPCSFYGERLRGVILGLRP